MTEIYSETRNGKVFRCSSCNQIHIEYKNLNFNFSNAEYDFFANYFLKLDGDLWEERNKDTHYSRKIIVPVSHKNLNIILNKEELEELKILLGDKRKKYKMKLINHNHFRFDEALN